MNALSMTKGGDQTFLQEYIYPLIDTQHELLMHDSHHCDENCDHSKVREAQGRTPPCSYNHKCVQLDWLFVCVDSTALIFNCLLLFHLFLRAPLLLTCPCLKCAQAWPVQRRSGIDFVGAPLTWELPPSTSVVGSGLGSVADAYDARALQELWHAQDQYLREHNGGGGWEHECPLMCRPPSHPEWKYVVNIDAVVCHCLKLFSYASYFSSR